MKGVLIDRCVDILAVMNAIGKETCEKYQWLVSYYEWAGYYDEIPFLKEYVLYDGKKLMNIITGGNQCIDGVFSAIPKGISEEEIVKYGLPDAKGEAGTTNFFDVEERKITHPLAEIEICSFDSTCVTVLAKDESVEERVAKAFADDVK